MASLDDEAVPELVRDQVRQLRDGQARQQRLEKLLVSAYRRLPEPNHLDTIPGIGDVSAAVRTAVLVDVERFATPGQLVKSWGVLPIAVASGVDRDGHPRGPQRYVMSSRGNDLVRRYLWMAALSAVRHNPAVRALDARVVAQHPDRKAIAIGHAMRKLLHLVFAVWKTGKPFDPQHYPWATPAHLDGAAVGQQGPGTGNREPEAAPSNDIRMSQEEPAAGLKPAAPAQTEVTAAGSVPGTVPETQPASSGLVVDFAHVKRPLPIARVLDQLGLMPRRRGKGPQKRCPCPIHRGDARGSTFSVHLDNNVFHGFARECGHQGDVIELWARVHGLSLRDAALDLVRTFDREATPARTEKRHG
jgi:hypothetical protein